MKVWKFDIQQGRVTAGRKQRRTITVDGCNEPFKSRFWCPERRWFMTAPCPFENRRECRNFEIMCGIL